MTTLLGLFFAALPIVVLVAILRLVHAAQGRRAAEIAHQIHLTDALHARLGALLAPVVTRPRGRPWQVAVMVERERLDVVRELLAVAGDEFSSRDPRRAEAFEIVLSPREEPRPRASRPAAAARRAEMEVASWT
jgi:hypothetical protein